jgi:4a-hydroxytetrahydrobiopterin dehydratase
MADEKTPAPPPPPAPTRRLLPPEEVDERLRMLIGWERDEDTIKKTYKVPGWSDAIALVARIGVVAASWDHHPDLVKIKYNRVTVVYTTHEPKGLTDMDFAVADSLEGKGGAI